MMGRTHLVVGVLCGLLLERALAPANVNAYYAFVMIGALLPDIDHQGSTINRILPLTRYAAKVMHHRGIFHTIFLPVVISLIGTLTGYVMYSLYVVIGYMSHLLSDSLTEQGVNWLHPFSEERIHGPIHTGTWMEYCVFILSLVLCGIMII